MGRVVAFAVVLTAGCAHEQGARNRLVAAVQSKPVVLLGEVHDNAMQHALRLDALRALVAGGARPALLMEQFDHDRQADLDRARAIATADAESVVAAAASHPAGWNWDSYRPFVALALRYRLPIIAANLSRAAARRVIEAGTQAAGFDAADVPADILEGQASAIAASHCGAVDAGLARRMAFAQVARDRLMARLVETHAARGALLLAGNGHVRTDIGVARWLSAAVRERSVAVGLVEEGDAASGSFDVVVVTARQPRSDPCAQLRNASGIRR